MNKIVFNPFTRNIDYTGSEGSATAAGVSEDSTYLNSITSNYFAGITDVQAALNKFGDGFVALSGLITAGTSSVIRAINKTAHGLSVGDVVHLSGGSESGSGVYVKSKADTEANAVVDGMVSAVADANNFTLWMGGYATGFTGLTGSTTYYLSPTTAGALTSTKPTTPGQIIAPVFRAIGTTRGEITIGANWQTVPSTYTLQDKDLTDTTYYYYGTKDTADNYKIKRYTRSTATPKYATGSGYSSAWSGRTGLTYA